jgi:hypothetical protein
MSYTVKYRNSVEIAVDSLDEAILLAERLAGPPSNGHTPIAPTASTPTQSGGIRQFVAALKAEPKDGLRAILGHDGVMGADDLCALLGMDSGMALAGTVISPIVKSAKKAGLNPASVLVRSKRKNAKGRLTNVYTVPVPVREQIGKELNM